MVQLAANTEGFDDKSAVCFPFQQSHLSNPVSLALVAANNQAALTTTAAAGQHGQHGQPATGVSAQSSQPGQQQQQQPAGNPAAAGNQAAVLAAAAAAGNTANYTTGYNLANVDMSSFQGVDWNSVYGMGMYV